MNTLKLTYQQDSQSCLEETYPQSFRYFSCTRVQKALLQIRKSLARNVRCLRMLKRPEGIFGTLVALNSMLNAFEWNTVSFRGASTFPTASLLHRKLFFLHSCDLAFCSCRCQHPLCWSHRLPAPCCSCNRRIAPRAGVSSQSSWNVSPHTVTSHKRRQPASQEHAVQHALSCLPYPHWIKTETILPTGTRRWEFHVFYCGVLNMPVLLLCPLSLCLLFHRSTQLQWEGFNHSTPPKPGAFLLQVWKGEFKLSEMSGVARCDHRCLLCLNSCCSPLRRSCHMFFLEPGEEWEENEPVWRGRGWQRWQGAETKSHSRDPGTTGRIVQG